MRILPTALLGAVILGSFPGVTTTAGAVAGTGVGCQLMGAGPLVTCSPYSAFSLEARESGSGSITEVTRDGRTRRIELDCVLIRQRRQQGSIMDELVAAGIDLNGERWHVRAWQDGPVDGRLSLSNHEPGDGPCGSVTEGFVPLPPVQIAHFVFAQ